MINDLKDKKESKIGYIYDNRHFVFIDLTEMNTSEMVHSKEKREIWLIQKEIYSCGMFPKDFQIVHIQEVKLKFRSYYIYILKNTKTKKGCAAFIEDHEVRCMHLKGYNFTDPYAKNTDWIKEDIEAALNATGKLKESMYQ